MLVRADRLKNRNYTSLNDFSDSYRQQKIFLMSFSKGQTE